MLVFPKKYQKKEFVSYAKNYALSMQKAFENINLNELSKISEIIFKTIKQKKKIFIVGNGGSAAIANHFTTDFNKGVYLSTQKKISPKFYSLSNSAEMITAISNDISCREIFSKQLEILSEKDDAIIVLSSSGESENIKEVIKLALKKNITIIFITGFKKKKPKKIKFFLNLKCRNYGITEDLFSIILHIISQFIRFKFSNIKEIL